MGERITFRGRVRGGIIGSGVAVSATDTLVLYRKGWLTGGTDPADGSVEVGDGTDYPLEVSIEQMEAINYRIKQVGCASCFAVTLGGGSFTREWYFNPPTLPRDPVDQWDDLSKHEVFFSDGRSVNATTEAGVQALLDSFRSDSYFGSIYEVGAASIFLSPAWSSDPTSEFSLFASSMDVKGPVNGKGVGFSTRTFRKGFPSPWPAPSFGAYRTGNNDTTVANGDSQLWMSATIGNAFTESGYPIFTSGSSAFATIGTFNLDLTGIGLSTISCNLRLTDSGFTSPSTLTMNVTPTAWWPYKNQAGQPLWNEDTGASINGSFTD